MQFFQILTFESLHISIIRITPEKENTSCSGTIFQKYKRTDAWPKSQHQIRLKERVKVPLASKRSVTAQQSVELKCQNVL